jgi:hypothetical protein
MVNSSLYSLVLFYILEGTPIPRELRSIAGDLAQKISFDDNVQGIQICFLYFD